YVFVPHATSLEPPTGMIEAQIKLTDLPGSSPIAPGASAVVFAKSTFWFVRTEPVLPVFIINGQPRIVGRTVYQLEILTDGKLRATIGNDDPLTPGAPWRVADSGTALALGVWNRVAMRWDGCNLRVILNGSFAADVAYNPVPILGLSYQGTGDDPTFGPLTLNAAMADNVFGKIDEVRISRVAPCTSFTIASTNRLISNVRALNLPAGIEDSLVSILQQVVTVLGPDPTPLGPDPTPFRVAAVNLLRAFINAVEAQRGRIIASADADALIAVANQLIAGLTI
ncbi:MAG: LamG-like jellyroll fold domain-containing protein, partial [Gammaproteobacteria bacterium]